MSTLLFGVEPTDPATFAGVATGLAAIALIPLIYLVRAGITHYLGEARARELREQAAA